jgi:hypothetical protein
VAYFKEFDFDKIRFRSSAETQKPFFRVFPKLNSWNELNVSYKEIFFIFAPRLDFG